MKNKLLHIAVAFGLLFYSATGFAQTISLGSASGFVLFTSNGAVSNSGISHITGNVGSNSGSSTAFGNVNGVMNDNNSASAICASDLLNVYGQLNSATPSFFPAPLLGNGTTLVGGVYSISGAATLNSVLNLDAQGDPTTVFIFQVQGAFSTNASAKVKLLNGALACNVFWKIEGLVSMASGTSMKGTILANNAAINMNAGDTLEGRALSINGAITIDGTLAYLPVGCGSPLLSGPAAPALASAGCYALFSTDGAVTNSGITVLKGDVGTNNGLTTGFNSLTVNGTVHPIPDVSTAACAADLLNVYNYLNTLVYDIELLYPAQFGNNLVLTPHVYRLNGATDFTDTLYLNALGNTNAVFVIGINGALITSTNAKVLLINGAQAKNVFWRVDGAVDINSNSVFNGIIVCNNGAVSLKTGVTLNGSAFTTNGSLTTEAVIVNSPTECSSIPTGIKSPGGANAGGSIGILPNPFTTVLIVDLHNHAFPGRYNMEIYDGLGTKVIQSVLTESQSAIQTHELPQGIYYYAISDASGLIKSGKLVCNL